MIEYALLFALGFLAATLAGLLIAPAVQRRVVKFTEDRLKATMPLSAAEVRAQKDMARAAYAVENARLSQDVARAREKHVREMVRNEKLLAEAAAVASENAELHAQIADMNVEAGDMRSALRREELKSEQLRALLQETDRTVRSQASEIETLTARLDHLHMDIDNLKIEIATRDTEIESLRSRAGNLRDERDRQRAELKTAQQESKSLQIKLSREETKIRQLETRLSREIAGSADKDNAIEQRIAEITRLREKMKNLAPVRESARAARALAAADTGRSASAAPRKNRQSRQKAPVDIIALEEEVRNQGTALSERLLAAKSGANDEALREEMADLATKMIVLTASREGASSPVHGLLASVDGAQDRDGRSLASRVRDELGTDEN